MMLDRLPPLVRHLTLLLLATALTWAGTDLVPYLEGRGGLAALAAALITAAVAWVSPLTRQYGVGKPARR
jgi:hypothetical protein